MYTIHNLHPLGTHFW